MPFEQILLRIKAVVTLTDEDIQLFKAESKILIIKKGQEWQSMNAIASRMCFINSGILRQYYVKDDSEFVEAFFTTSEFAGNYVSYIQQSSSQVCIEALEDTEILEISFKSLENLSSKNSRIANFVNFVSQSKLNEMNERAASLLKFTPEERYVQLTKNKPFLETDIPQYYIAQYLGIKPESLSRLKKRALKS